MKRPNALRFLSSADDEPTNPEDHEMRFRTAVTGRENRVIFWCPACKRQEKPIQWPIQEYGFHMRRCQDCHEVGMRFVAYEGGVEDAIAKRLIDTGELPDA